MVKSLATTPEEYLAGLPDDKRPAIAGVRDVILRNLPKGYRETVGYGMLTYCVPLARYPDTYNGQPLCYAALAAHKSYCALYLMSAYGDPDEARWLAREFEKAGKKLDMGKSCLRFRSPDDLPLDAIGSIIARTSPEDFVRRYEASRAKPSSGGKPRAAGTGARRKRRPS